MAMVIKSNVEAMRTLGELNRHNSALGQQLKKISSGMRINGAGDDASGYSISEKMRVRIRALDQNERNVQNGAALLRTAEGAIQQQIEIMKNIKAKVIDADNDTNTDIDRATIQKEIEQGYRQIEDIAQETTYNGKRLLVGDTVGETIRSWVVSSESSLLPGSDEMRMIDLNMIADNYDTLNGITGPFDLFTPSKIESATLDRLGFSPTIQFEGGVDNTYKIDSSFATVDSLDGTAFGLMYSSRSYVLTRNPSSEHQYGGFIYGDSIVMPSGVTEIDINGCNTVADVMAAIKNAVYCVTGYGEDYLTTTENFYGVPFVHRSADVTSVAGTGKFSGIQYFSGGKNEEGTQTGDHDSADYQPAVKASFSLSGLAAHTGITVHNENTLHFLRFVTGDSAPVKSNPPCGVTTVGVDYSGSISFGNMKGTMSGGTLTLYAPKAGTQGNTQCYAEDGIQGKTYEFLATNPLTGTNASQSAYATVDVSGYDSVNTLIEDLRGKALAFSWSNGYAQNSWFENGYPYDYSNRDEFSHLDAPYHYVEFIDSGSSDPMDGMYKFPHSASEAAVVDLNVLRTKVAAGQSIAEAFWECCESQTSRVYLPGARIEEAVNAGGQTIGIKVMASSYGPGTKGNLEKLFLTQNQLRSYTLDYGKWFSENSGVSVPEFLDGKGFRVYCATCEDQWFNFRFVTEDLPDGRPKNSDPESEDIKDIYINVSGVTDAESLVQAIYDQATPYLEGASEDYNHFMRLVADGDKLTVYDERRLTDSYLKNVRDASGNLLYEYQWDDTYQVGGAKIADGVWDNVTIGELDRNVKDLVIHHTDRASQNIRLRINQTTLDHLFGYQAGTREWSEFNVMTAASREELLGNKAGATRSGGYAAEDEKGLLDMALDYLTSANTLVGAQMMRLGMAEANIVTARESTTASESTIRDADMAREMVGYTKANILAQSAQSMLAQANQNSSSVLGLLQ